MMVNSGVYTAVYLSKIQLLGEKHNVTSAQILSVYVNGIRDTHPHFSSTPVFQVSSAKLKLDA